MSEESDQRALFSFLATIEGRLPMLAFAFHVPNEASGGGAKVRMAYERRNGGIGHRWVPIEALKNAQLGTRKGVPDVLFILPNQVALDGYDARHFHGLAIELKSARGKLSDEQRAWAAHLLANGWYVVVEREWTNAAALLVMWAGGDPREHGLEPRERREL